MKQLHAVLTALLYFRQQSNLLQDESKMQFFPLYRFKFVLHGVQHKNSACAPIGSPMKRIIIVFFFIICSFIGRFIDYQNRYMAFSLYFSLPICMYEVKFLVFFPLCRTFTHSHACTQSFISS